jgi:hypothetical protein
MLQRTVHWSRVIEATDIAGARFDALEQLVGELELAWSPDAVRDFVAPASWHASASPAG